MTVKNYNDMVPMLRAGLLDGQGLKYKRISDVIERGIEEGVIAPGTKLPPHRRLSDQLGVTVATVSRAYGELERLGRVVARIGDGTFVRDRAREQQRDRGFRHPGEGVHAYFDMSRNTHIPGAEAECFARSLQALASDPQVLAALANYAPEVGFERHRQAGARWLSHGGFVASAQQVVCVNGGQHGLLSAMLGLLKSGDTLVTENLSYPGLISAARLLGIRLIGVEMDAEGLLPQAVEEACRGHRISALYCTPTLQNPIASVQSFERRQALVEVCRRHNLLIIEDETHGVLVQDRPEPLSFFAPERTILIGSLSKAVAAGLRVGYVHGPQALIARLAGGLRASCWMATPLMHELAAQWIEDGDAQALLARQVVEISRRKALVEGLLAGLEYRTHANSPHFWISVPQSLRASEVESALKERGYLIATAELFAVGHGAAAQCVRASVCNTTGDDRQLQAGFAALAQVLEQDRLPGQVI
ncbi:PLP-dependent aminotransferase family protein [Pseudomonas gingeri]|uniref:aminotransferase-like domain-containing protein n=1 Tax=Pseudomonas gingeri TaxID=117681 RepID=UPI0015A069A7|nr:PLP-dependent aminotransferase family protein [Pseudomonas gingeri]NVZ26831.1 PLP-dependent aminotransferase family protein [Pseudomonas gingeri]NWA09850.1 PLP-dependent aminotransferase family protein [Pseudomonas gingeri]